MYQYKYPHAAITADAVVFGFDGYNLHILLIQRGIEPFKGSWALPGGFMKMDETIDECAARELREETSVTNVYMEQFHVFSSVNRDPRERVVTVAFIALVRKADFKIIAGDDAANASWFDVNDLPPLAFDHAQIIAKARKYLREVIRNRPVAFKLLDQKFYMADLQRLYEAINGTSYDRRNFAKKVTSCDLVNFDSVSDTPSGSRYANLYTFNFENVDESTYKNDSQDNEPENCADETTIMKECCYSKSPSHSDKAPLVVSHFSMMDKQNDHNDITPANEEDFEIDFDSPKWQSLKNLLNM